MKLHDLVVLGQRHPTQGAFFERHVKDAIDLLGTGRGPEVGLMPFGSTGFFGLAGIVGLLAAKRMSLAMIVAATVIELSAKLAVFALEKLDAPIALLATGTLRRDGSHDALPKLCADDNGIELREV